MKKSLEDVFDLGVALAIKETQLAEDSFPENRPYRRSDILESGFFGNEAWGLLVVEIACH